MTAQPASIAEFLLPLQINPDMVNRLSQKFLHNFEQLAAQSENQFLPTPITESVLRPTAPRDHGCHLAIDIGGTNLRVGFVQIIPEQGVPQLDGNAYNGTLSPGSAPTERLQRLLERSWPIDEHLKNENADGLFFWIGQCIAEVVRDGCNSLHLTTTSQAVPLGVSFSFPMIQHSLSEATLMSMGKGFAITSNLNLGAQLQEGYNRAKAADLPPIQVEAIANDSVSTLISFVFTYDTTLSQRATMGLILGTGCNATIPLKLDQLHPSKRPEHLTLLPGERLDNVKITVNTELSINGSAPPLQELGLISQWDKVVSSQNESPGFQPMEYMTAGRYLGELGRVILVDYMTGQLGVGIETLPAKLLQRHGLTTTFLSHFKPLDPQSLLSSLRREFAESTGAAGFAWTEEVAAALYHIAKAIEVRAAGIVAAAVVALLTLAEELPATRPVAGQARSELGVGYTGGCIAHFQDYKADCQAFLDQLLINRFGEPSPFQIALRPCHDGGITGAGILLAAAPSKKRKQLAIGE